MSKLKIVPGVIVACQLIVLGIFATPSAAASLPDGYPVGPIKVIVPYGKGGGSDQLVQAMVTSVNALTGIEFSVDHLPGDGGLKAVPPFMDTKADGYTILEHIDDAVAAYAAGNIEPHPGKDWVPLGMMQITFSQLFIRTDDPRFSDWDSFLAYTQRHPGEVAVANVSYDGSMERIIMQRLERAVGLKVRQVSFDKPKERYDALLKGRVDVLFEQPGDVRKFVEDGQMRPMLTFLNERPSAFAEVPTHRDVGADFEPLLRFRGFYVKDGTPDERIDFLEQRLQEGFQSASFQAFNKSKYMTLIDPYRNRQDSVDLINTSIETYRQTYQDMLFELYQKFIKQQANN